MIRAVAILLARLWPRTRRQRERLHLGDGWRLLAGTERVGCLCGCAAYLEVPTLTLVRGRRFFRVRQTRYHGRVWDCPN